MTLLCGYNPFRNPLSTNAHPVFAKAPAKINLKASDCPIKYVTVFRSSNAQVVRNFSLHVKAGSNQIEITGLSSSIDTESLRVSGLGEACIADVVCCIVRPPHNCPGDGTESPEVLKAKSKIQALEFAKKTREEEIESLSRHAKTYDGCSGSANQLVTLPAKIATKKLAAAKKLRALEDRIRELEVFVGRSHEPIKGEANAKAKIAIAASKNGFIELTLTYLVGNARWTPTYNLYTTANEGVHSPSVSLHYRALLSQCTGEHWDTPFLCLTSAITDFMGGEMIPEPNSLRIQATSDYGTPFITGPIPGFAPTCCAPEGTFPPRGFQTRDDRYCGFPLAQPALPMYEGTAFVTKSPDSTSYVVNCQASIPSDAELHNVPIVQLSFEAKITHVIIPRQQTLAYLQCEVKNNSDYQLLPGPVSVFVNNAYASKKSMPDTSQGDVFRLHLGVDTSTRVSYEIVSTSETPPAFSLVEQYRATTYTATTIIHNGHKDHAINVLEKSSIPIAPPDDTRIRVFLKKPEGLVESEDGVDFDSKLADGFRVRWGTVSEDQGKREGKFTREGRVAPGDKVTLVSEWEVRAHGEVGWTELSS